MEVLFLTNFNICQNAFKRLRLLSDFALTFFLRVSRSDAAKVVTPMQQKNGCKDMFNTFATVSALRVCARLQSLFTLCLFVLCFFSFSCQIVLRCR